MISYVTDAANRLSCDCTPRTTVHFSEIDAIVPNLMCMPLCARPTLKVHVSTAHDDEHFNCLTNLTSDDLLCREYCNTL